MSKNQNYYVSVTAEANLDDGSNVTASSVVKLAPGCDSTWLENVLSKDLADAYNHKVNECVITSLSQISKGLYDRLTNKE